MLGARIVTRFLVQFSPHLYKSYSQCSSTEFIHAVNVLPPLRELHAA